MLKAINRLFGGLTFAPYPVSIRIKVVGVRREDFEAPIGYVFAIQIWWRWRDADIRVRGVAARGKRWRSLAPEAKVFLSGLSLSFKEQISTGNIRRVGECLGISVPYQSIVDENSIGEDVAEKPAIAVSFGDILKQEELFIQDQGGISLGRLLEKLLILFRSIYAYVANPVSFALNVDLYGVSIQNGDG